MAVKVIREDSDDSVKKQVVCRDCGATLEYVPNDVKSRHGQDYSGGPDGCTWVDCPACGGAAIIESW